VPTPAVAVCSAMFWVGVGSALAEPPVIPTMTPASPAMVIPNATIVLTLIRLVERWFTLTPLVARPYDGAMVAVRDRWSPNVLVAA